MSEERREKGDSFGPTSKGLNLSSQQRFDPIGDELSHDLLD